MAVKAKPTKYEDDADQLAALRAPFPITEIRTREQSGATLHYYEGHTISQRLLDVLGTGFNVTTVQHITANDRVEMEVVIEVEWMSGKRCRVSGWGSADILTGKSGKVVNDPYKTAYTDGLKVAASKLGCGNELYDSKYREGLAAIMEAERKAEAEKAFLTCQGCKKAITEGEVKTPDGKTVTLTATQVATNTRQKFGERLCLPCARAKAGN
jgi:hypothetical protein